MSRFELFRNRHRAFERFVCRSTFLIRSKTFGGAPLFCGIPWLPFFTRLDGCRRSNCTYRYEPVVYTTSPPEEDWPTAFCCAASAAG